MQCWFYPANSNQLSRAGFRGTPSNVVSRKFLQVAFDQQPKQLTWNGTWFPPLSNRIPQLRCLHLNGIFCCNKVAGQTSSILWGEKCDLLQLHSRMKQHLMCHPVSWTTLLKMFSFSTQKSTKSLCPQKLAQFLGGFTEAQFAFPFDVSKWYSTGISNSISTLSLSRHRHQTRWCCPNWAWILVPNLSKNSCRNQPKKGDSPLDQPLLAAYSFPRGKSQHFSNVKATES